MSKRRLFKRLDDRTGRLERAVNLINDGEQPNLRVHKREADQPHPLTRPRAIPPDRSVVLGMKGPSGNDEGMGFTYEVGLTTSSTSLYQQRTVPTLTLSSGGYVLTYVEA